MKYIFSFLIILFLPSLLLAKKSGPESQALYIVPTPAELVPFSRFKIEIVHPYEGDYTQKIAYVFPEGLIGEPNRLIELSRIPDTENSWTSDELTAHCVTTDDIFSCNVYVNKDKEVAINQSPWYLQWLLPQALAARGGLCSGIVSMDSPMSAVQGHFCSNEPAGILSYEFQ